MAIKTYKTPDNKIYTETGEYIPDLADYQAKVRAGVYQTSTPVNTLPSVVRTSDGGIASKVDLASSIGGLSKLSSNQAFLQAAKDIIQRKQQISQPLSEQKAYWRTLQRDTSPFGGMRDEALNIPGTFTDERMRELSPSEQASVRASRDAAASAHLQGISEEEKERGTRTEDIVKSIGDLLTEKDKVQEDKLINEARKLEIIAKKKDLGMPITDEDYKEAGLDATNGRTGGTISWRYNNPGNIKWTQAMADKYGATKGNEATDGGNFAIFPDLETGEKARKELITGSRIYQGLSPDQAMKVWSGGVSTTPTAQDKVGFFVTGLGKRYLNDKGYTYQKLVQLGAPSVSKPFDKFSDDEWNQLTDAWRKAEGWKEGTIIGQSDEVEHTTWTEANVRTLASQIPGADSNTLWRTKTDSELDALNQEVSSDVVGKIIDKLKPAALLRIGITQSDAREILTLKQMGMSDDEIKEMMKELKLDPKVLDQLNELLTSQESTSDMFAIKR